MRVLNSKTKLTAAITIVILMVSAFMLMATPLRAQEYTNVQEGGSIPLPAGVTPDVEFETIAHISFRPNPVGVGQPLLVNVWLQPPTHVARYFKDAYIVTFTSPSDNEIEVGPLTTYHGDSTSWFEYVFDEVGTWQIKFDFLGGYFPPGNYTPFEGAFGGNLNAPLGVYYEPSSDGPYDFVVQEELALSWPPAPLPTDYWTRPASVENREWWPILGNFPPTGIVAGVGRGVTLDEWPANTNKYVSNYGFIPYVQGPKSAHILWKREGADGGLVGGTIGIASYQPRPGGPSIVFNGRCYQSVTKVYNGETQNVWQCYDLRTGEIFWEKTGITQVPNMIMYSEREIDVVPGEAASTLGMRIELMYVGGGRLITYDPWTGAKRVDMPIDPLSSGDYYASYDWPYFLSVQNLGAGEYRLINWTIEGDPMGFSLGNFRLGVLNNVSFPFSRYNVADYEAMIGVSLQSISPSSIGTSFGLRIMGASLETGDLLCNVTTDPTKGYEGPFSTSTAVADHGKFAIRLNDGHWHCWDLTTGQKLWRSELSSWPWGTFGCYTVVSYGGNIISNNYDGIVALNWTTGKISWWYKYNPEYPYETPYSNSETGETYYPFYSSRGSSGSRTYIADGVYYCYNDEHSVSEPIPRGYKLHAINVTTGEGIWNVTGRTVPYAISDGYLVGANMYDGYMYVFGKGKSETAVSGPQTAVPLGNSMMITGSVLDMSPAQPGTPCVSKDSMATQMEYLHMQHPIDGVGHNEVISGVPVTLTAIDSDGVGYNIGTVTTSGYHGTFGKGWTPPKQDTYEIIASFAGDDSYGSSSASTYVLVGPASSAATPETEPPTTAPPTTAPPTTAPPTTAPPTSEAPTTAPPTSEQPSGEAPFPTTEVVIVAAVVVAVVIGIGAYWALRRRK